MKQTQDVAVLAAEIAVNGAKRRVEQLQIELKAAEADLGKAYEALNDARLAADAKLPTAEMEVFDWCGRKTTRSDMVITKRSAKSITVRYPGTDSGFTFRVDGGGSWREFPRPKGLRNVSRKLVGL